mgnify:CR=1 FL=1
MSIARYLVPLLMAALWVALAADAVADALHDITAGRGQAAGRVAAGVLVPAAAVRRSGERDVVFVVTEGRVERRAVAQTGFGDKTVRVTGGLSAGETVVLDPPADLEDGDAVKEKNNG